MAQGKITLQMLSEIMASNTGRSKTSTEVFVRTFFATLKDALAQDNIIKIKGFGTFKMVVVNARESINVNTGKRVSIAEYNKISFSPDKNLKEKINRPFSQFETIIIDDEDLDIINETNNNSVEDNVNSDDTENYDAVPTDGVQDKKEINIQTIPPTQENTPTPLEDDQDLNPHIQEGEVKEAELRASSSETLVGETNQPSVETTNVVSDNAKNREQTTETIINDEAPTANTISDSQTEETMVSEKSKSSKMRWFWYISLGITLALFAYFAGYMRLVDFTSNKTEISKNVSIQPTIHKKNKKNNKDIIKHVKETTKASLPDSISKFPQINDGKYLIVGIKTYRKIKPDYDVRRYCLQIYGKEDCTPYVLLLNDIKEEKQINVGDILKFPILVENNISK